MEIYENQRLKKADVVFQIIYKKMKNFEERL